MSKEKEPKETPVDPPKDSIKAEPEKVSQTPISIMGDPTPVPKPESITVKAFSDLQQAVEQIGAKINGLIPPAPTAPIVPAPEPKKYRVFDEFEVF